MGQAKNRFMEEEARGWSDTGKHVCASCLTAPPLQAAIRSNLVKGQHCDFCNAKHAASLDLLMEKHIMPAIFEQYTQAVNELHWEDGEYESDPPDTHDFIEELFYKTEASSCTPLIDVIKDSIEFTNWCKQDYYGTPLDEIRLFYWRKFSHIVRYTNRYFFTDSILGDDFESHQEKRILPFLAETLKVIKDHLLQSRQTGTRLFRARVGSKQYTTLADLGALPYGKGFRSNRMSPAGISMFYGALDPETAKREVGPIPTGEVLSLASLTLLRNIQIIDFCDLPETPNFFELGQQDKRYMCSFLHKFVEELRAPVEKDGMEHIDYVPTQVLTEYLKSSLPIDGMIFPSAKKEGGNCIVLWGRDFVPYSNDSTVAIELAAVRHDP